MAPELVAEFVRAFYAEVNRQRRDSEVTVQLKRKELDEVGRKLAGLIDAIADGFRAPGLQAKLDELERRKAELEAAIASAPPPAPRLHPNLAEIYRKKVEALHEALADPAMHTEALEILRGLIERVTVAPAEGGAFIIELVGEIARMVALGAEAKNTKTALEGAAVSSSVKVVAGARNLTFLTPPIRISLRP